MEKTDVVEGVLESVDQVWKVYEKALKEHNDAYNAYQVASVYNIPRPVVFVSDAEVDYYKKALDAGKIVYEKKQKELQDAGQKLNDARDWLIGAMPFSGIWFQVSDGFVKYNKITHEILFKSFAELLNMLNPKERSED